mmetsp:Transcript_1295/g.3106  ORF Transcript_1295/g.3106 Transcript_1295/m.3106 type:complete len:525 (+) Transcript_1295:225-1799(+)
MRQPACSLVDSIDLILVASNNRLALELHRSSEHVILRCPWVGDECDLLGDLKAHELALLARSQARLAHLRNDVLVLAQALDVGGIDALGLREGLEMGHAGADEGDAEALARVRVAHGDLHVLGYLECVLHLGQCHVLALLELDQVLLAVDDLEVAVLVDLANVPGAEVAHPLDGDVLRLVLLGHVLVDVVRVDEITLSHHGASDEHLAAGHADVRLVLVRREVVAFGPVPQADASGGSGRAHTRGGVVAEEGHNGARARLGESIALAHGAIEDSLHKLLHVRREGRGARDHGANAAAEEGLDLLEDQGVEDGPSAHAARVEVAHPCGQPHVEELLHKGGRLGHLGLDGGVHLVQDSWGEDHHGGLEQGRVARLPRRELNSRVGERVRRAVADGHAPGHVGHLHHHLHDVGEWQVGQINIVDGLLHEGAQGLVRARHARHEVAVRDEHTLGQARGARGVHDHRDVFRSHVCGLHGGLLACLDARVHGGDRHAEGFELDLVLGGDGRVDGDDVLQLLATGRRLDEH